MIAAIKPNVASQAKAPISDATILRISRLFQGVRDGRVHPKRAPPSYENSASAAQCQKRARTHPTAGIAAAMTLTPAHFPDEQRSVLRAVALAYRRACRAGASSEGECHDAALWEYRRICSDAPADQLAASGQVHRMVAAAINADTRWFWHGPDV